MVLAALAALLLTGRPVPVKVLRTPVREVTPGQSLVRELLAS
jgi:hypothetical protein